MSPSMKISLNNQNKILLLAVQKKNNKKKNNNNDNDKLHICALLAKNENHFFQASSRLTDVRFNQSVCLRWKA